VRTEIVTIVENLVIWLDIVRIGKQEAKLGKAED